LVGAEVHPADMQDRDGAPLVIAAIHDLFPWLRLLFADSAYAGDKLLNMLTKFVNWYNRDRASYGRHHRFRGPAAPLGRRTLTCLA
jgi:hypothetical protein